MILFLPIFLGFLAPLISGLKGSIILTVGELIFLIVMMSALSPLGGGSGPFYEACGFLLLVNGVTFAIVSYFKNLADKSKEKARIKAAEAVRQEHDTTP